MVLSDLLPDEIEEGADDVSDAVDPLRPEVDDGPFSIPVVKPQGAPSLPAPEEPDFPDLDIGLDE